MDGLNDIHANSSSEISTAITLFCNYVNENYPNAHIYIGCIGWHRSLKDQGARNQVVTRVLLPYKNSSSNKNTTYLDGVEYPMHYYSFYREDSAHPNDIGEMYIANAIYQSYQQGYARFFSSLASVKSSTGCYLETQILANKLMIKIYGNIISELPDVSTIGNKTINLGTAHEAFIRNVNNLSKLRCRLLLNYENSHFETKDAYITINSKAELIINFYNSTKGTLLDIRIDNCYREYDLLYF